MVRKEYPADATKNEKRRLREKPQSFAVVDGILMHHSGGADRLCRVVADEAERHRTVASLHADDVGGSHFGQAATIKKVTERFWWRNVADDTRQYVRRCDVCQKANPVNKAPPSTLHPVSVKGVFQRWPILIMFLSLVLISSCSLYCDSVL